jgi:hypothetical protein
MTVSRNGATVADLAHALLTRIDALNPRINAYVAIDRDAVLRDARALDAIPEHARGPLHGLTAGIKDIIDVAGLPTRVGSSFFRRDRRATDRRHLPACDRARYRRAVRARRRDRAARLRGAARRAAAHDGGAARVPLAKRALGSR